MEISWENKMLFSYLYYGGEKMKKAIYKITNKINNKIYIGQSSQPKERFLQHCRNYKESRSLINKAIQKWGVENFDFEIIGWFEDYNEKEKYYIAYYGSISPNGYNLTTGGDAPPVGSHKKITLEVARQIQQDLLNENITRKQIISKYKITNDIVRHINDGSSWKDESLKYPLRPSERELLNKKVDKVIELLLNTKLTQKEIGQLVGWNRSAITMINIGKNYKRENIDYPIRK